MNPTLGSLALVVVLVLLAWAIGDLFRDGPGPR